MKIKNSQKGLGLIETVVGVGIVALTIVGLIGSYNLFLRRASSNIDDVKANFLVEEGLEAVRIIRDDSWSTFSGLATSTNHHLSFDGTSWTATSTNTFIDGEFERSFILEDTFRDSGDKIASSGTLDPSSRKVTVHVSFAKRGATTTRSVSAYFANIFE